MINDGTRLSSMDISSQAGQDRRSDSIGSETSIKIPKYQYVEFDFSFWAKCGRRWAGDWIGGSSGSTSPGDCAANGCGAAATFVGDFAISDRADEPGRTGADHSGLFAEPVGLCRCACD